MNKFLAIAAVFLVLNSCSKNEKGLKVAATSVPHSEMLEFIQPDLKAQGINLIIITTDDYNIPNRALADHEVDANFFQHHPFFDAQIQAFQYPLEVLSPIEIEPMGFYSTKIHAMKDLEEKSVVAIPNDPSNEARALFLLQSVGLIELESPENLHSTVLDIKSNPKNLSFIEVDAAMLPRVLSDVTLAAINTNYALQAGFNPEKDALLLESKDSPYANILVIRKGDAEKPDIQALKAVMTSEKMKDFILKKYNHAILPAWQEN